MAPFAASFSNDIFHPNVAEDGFICNRLAGDHWSPALGPSAMLTYARALLDCPNFAAKDRGDVDSEDSSLAADEEARRIGGLKMPQKLYHYTSDDGATSISQAKKLRASSSGAAGAGIYATTMHPTNYTRSQIETNNWGSIGTGSRSAFVVELDVAALEAEGFRIEKAIENRDVWLITGMIGSSSFILLSDSNSVIMDFEHMSSCMWNKEAGRLFMQNSAEYYQHVARTIQTFGQHLPALTRQQQC